MALAKTFADGELLTASDLNMFAVNHVPSIGDVYDTGYVTNKITLASGYSEVGGTWAPLGARRQGMRVVGRGLIQTSTVRASQGTLATITDPLWRPPHNMIKTIMAQSAQTTGPASTGTAHTHTIPATYAPMRVSIFTTGEIRLDAASSAQLPANGWISFDDLWWDL